MIATKFGCRMLALAALGAALVGCDSIKDVREEASTPLPTQAVVLKGTVTNLSSKRAVTLIYNGTIEGAVAVAAPPPAENNEEVQGTTPFVFGSLPAGTPYNVQVQTQPTGKNCVVTSGGTGVLTAGVETNVVVTCTNTGTRYSMTVNLAPEFVSSPGAQVVLTTEERIYRINPAAGATSVTFNNVLFNPTPSPLAFTWNVIASNTQGGTLNKCPVTNAANPTAVVGGVTTTLSPTANITNVQVGACTFTIGGTVSYSPPVINGAAGPTPAAPTGLVLELRDLGENTVRTQAFSGAWGSTFTLSEGATPVQFVSNRNAIYSIAVRTHPTGMRCVVVTPMAVLYSPTLTSNPTNITTPSVQCRELPAAGRALRGVYRHMTTSWQSSASAPLQTVTYDAFNFAKQNTASSNVISLFENGTYIYGTHANSSQVEHGFYDYDPTAGTLRFTLNADTNTSTVFPSTFNPSNATSSAAATTTTPGLSAVPGTVVIGGARQATMTGVNVATAGRISGTFSGSQGLGALAATTPTQTVPSASMGWVLQAPPSIPGQMTGSWLAQDSRRLWTFDAQTYYGFHAGVVGVYTVNDACFTMPDVTVSTGLYTRRPSINGCYPWPRPATGQTFTFLGIVESIDLKVPNFIPNTAVSTAGGAVDIGTLPEYMARLPGAMQAADGRSPSPMYFHIAPAAQFYVGAPSQYFPTEPTNWCTTEILGIRATLNDVPIHKPVYFCRFVP